MVKDHSDSERKPAAAMWATLSNYQQGFFYYYMHHPTDRTAHTTALLYQSWSTGWNEIAIERQYIKIDTLIILALKTFITITREHYLCQHLLR